MTSTKGKCANPVGGPFGLFGHDSAQQHAGGLAPAVVDSGLGSSAALRVWRVVIGAGGGRASLRIETPGDIDIGTFEQGGPMCAVAAHAEQRLPAFVERIEAIVADERAALRAFAQEAGPSAGHRPWGSGTYSGQWADGGPAGVGTWIGTLRLDGKSQSKYVGEWIDGVRQGHGVETNDGATYDGEWRAGQRSGHGKATLPNGCTYEGSWKAGVVDGVGTMTWPDGMVYTGCWVDGKRDGRGTQVDPRDGTEYVGRWTAGQLRWLRRREEAIGLGPGHRDGPPALR